MTLFPSLAVKQQVWEALSASLPVIAFVYGGRRDDKNQQDEGPVALTNRLVRSGIDLSTHYTHLQKQGMFRALKHEVRDSLLLGPNAVSCP